MGARQARVAAMLLLTLRGTPTIYYGDEIGMHDAEVPAELQRDPAGLREPGTSRDPERTPMRWDGTPTRVHHRRALAADRRRRRDAINVEAESNGPELDADVLPTPAGTATRRAGALDRRVSLPLGVAGDVMAYERRAGTDAVSCAAQPWRRPGAAPELATEMRGTIVLATHVQREGQPFEPDDPLASGEGLIVRLA